jgi:hypothetical protein
MVGPRSSPPCGLSSQFTTESHPLYDCAQPIRSSAPGARSCIAVSLFITFSSGHLSPGALSSYIETASRVSTAWLKESFPLSFHIVVPLLLSSGCSAWSSYFDTSSDNYLCPAQNHCSTHLSRPDNALDHCPLGINTCRNFCRFSSCCSTYLS